MLIYNKTRKIGDNIMINDFRCIIKFDMGKSYIGIDYFDRKYSIKKNKYIRCRVGDDVHFFARRKKGWIIDTLTPVSDEEAYRQG